MGWILLLSILLGGCSGSFTQNYGNATCKVDHQHTTWFSAYGLAVCTETTTGRFLAMDLERGTSGGELAVKVAVGGALAGAVGAGLSGLETGTSINVPGLP